MNLQGNSGIDVHAGWEYVKPPWIAEHVEGCGWHVVDRDGTEAAIDDWWFTDSQERAESRAAELNARAS